jgi:hypothetical protein
MAVKALFSGMADAVRELDIEKFMNFRISGLIPKSIAFAEEARKRDDSWSKGVVYLLRGEFHDQGENARK